MWNISHVVLEVKLLTNRRGATADMVDKTLSQSDTWNSSEITPKSASYPIEECKMVLRAACITTQSSNLTMASGHTKASQCSGIAIVAMGRDGEGFFNHFAIALLQDDGGNNECKAE